MRLNFEKSRKKNTNIFKSKKLRPSKFGEFNFAVFEF